MLDNIEVQRSSSGAFDISAWLDPEGLKRKNIETWFNAWVERAQKEGPISTGKPVQLTPLLAKYLLERNPKNRSLHSKIKRYVRDIKDGKFSVNGTTIVISKEGWLNDGQNRCHAVIEADIAVQIFCVFGVTRESRGTLDIGKNRTPADILTFDGVQEGTSAAAVGSLIYQYCERGLISTRQEHRPTEAQLRALFRDDDNERIHSSLRFVGRKGLKALGGRAVLAFCHFILRSVDREDADYFIEKVITGEGLSPGHPALKCRERLLYGSRLTVNEKAELILRAWNFFREGHTPRHLQIVGRLPDLRG